MFRKRLGQTGNSDEDKQLDAVIAAARVDVPTGAENVRAQSNLLKAIRAKQPVQQPAATEQGVREPEQSFASQKAWRAGLAGAKARLRFGAPRSRPSAVTHPPMRRMVGLSLSAAVLLALVLVPLFFSPSGTSPARAAEVVGAGELRILAPDGSETTASCPLKHTNVEANITGFMSRSIVRQQFTNPAANKIEAIYIFPLPQDAAVDSMTMVVGKRRIVGIVKPRQEARATYNAARQAGHVAALLDQERPNIFTQSVANIEPGAQVEVEISFVQTLKSENGLYEFTFPMVVAPRYTPGEPKDEASTGTGVAVDTDRVPDASRITPCHCPPKVRAGHDISLQVYLDAGTEIFDLNSELHAIDVEKDGPTRAIVSLHNQNEIPNRDFVLKYRIAQERIVDAFLTSSNPRGSFFTLMLQPPRNVAPAQAVPKEMIFLIDRSGSMSGLPIEKAKESMRLCIEQMNPNDTFNLLSFSGGTGKCFPKPVENTADNRATAQKYLSDLTGSGGTEMMPAILEALTPAADPNHVRIVCFMTDGEIGNDFEIIDAVKKNAATARVFAFGIGNSVNRFLLDGIAREGRGEVEYVTLDNQPAVQASSTGGTDTQGATAAAAQDAAHRFAERIAKPVLTDISIDWGNLPVADVYPKAIPDLFSNKPIVVYGRLTGPATGTIWLRGKTASGSFERQANVAGSDATLERRDALDSLWARAKVDYLMHQDMKALQANKFPTELKDEITSVGVQFGIMTQFTSFVAVDESTMTKPAEPKKVAVPVEAADRQVVQDDSAGNVNLSLYDDAVQQKNQYGLPVAGTRTRQLGLPAQNNTLPQLQAREVERNIGNEPEAAAAKQHRARFYAESSELGTEPELQKAGAPNRATGSAGAPRQISPMPDVQIGDMEVTSGIDTNYFLFTNDFRFSNSARNYDTSNGTVSQGDVWGVKQGQQDEIALKRSRGMVAAKSSNAVAETTDAKDSITSAVFSDITFSPTTGTLAWSKNDLDKLSAELRPLMNSQKVLDPDGNSTGSVVVKQFMVHVRVVTDDEKAVISMLGKIRFKADGPSANGIIEGTLDVRQMLDLVRMPNVRSVVYKP